MSTQIQSPIIFLIEQLQVFFYLLKSSLLRVLLFSHLQLRRNGLRIKYMSNIIGLMIFFPFIKAYKFTVEVYIY